VQWEKRSSLGVTATGLSQRRARDDRGTGASRDQHSPERQQTIKEKQMAAQESPARPRIVVGIDGSPSSVSALRWAIKQAGLTGATVDAVIAWHYPELAASGMAVGSIEPTFGFRESAGKIVSDAINSALDPSSDVPVHPRVTQGHAAQVLVDASAGADLLVVGSRGHGGFVEALLGSVSQHCVHHAQCPVVVVRG
jgi:nucleotide-binding universal stress UspA family protein